jgi:hypothetical protein
MHGWAGGLHWKAAVDGRPAGPNGRFLFAFIEWLDMDNYGLGYPGMNDYVV